MFWKHQARLLEIYLSELFPYIALKVRISRYFVELPQPGCSSLLAPRQKSTVLQWQRTTFLVFNQPTPQCYGNSHSSPFSGIPVSHPHSRKLGMTFFIPLTNQGGKTERERQRTAKRPNRPCIFRHPGQKI